MKATFPQLRPPSVRAEVQTTPSSAFSCPYSIRTTMPIQKEIETRTRFHATFPLEFGSSSTRIQRLLLLGAIPVREGRLLLDHQHGARGVFHDLLGHVAQ